MRYNPYRHVYYTLKEFRSDISRMLFAPESQMPTALEVTHADILI